MAELTHAVSRILPALEKFIRFEGADLAALRSQWLERLDEPLPQEGAGAGAVLELLENVVIPHGLRTGAPGFSGWVTTMPSTTPAVAGFAGSLAAPQRWWISPGNFLEDLGLRWLRELLLLPATFGGAFSSGGSAANLIALGAARQHAGERRGVDVAAAGVGALVKPKVYASVEVHHAVQRALGVLGLGRDALRRIPVDAARRVRVDLMEAQLLADLKDGATPVALVATAGDVNTGAVDPIAQLVALARRHEVWLHVDGAYGAFGRLSERVQPLFEGMSEAHSIAVDPHKWLTVPIGVGATFVRDVALLERAFAMEAAAYLEGTASQKGDVASAFDELGYEFHNRGMEQSAPSRGLVVWAALKELGADGMRRRVDLHLDLARRVAQRVRALPEELELLSEPVLSICCFRYRRPELSGPALDQLNERILKLVRQRGRCVPSSTVVAGAYAVRPCFINPRSTLADADALVDEVLAAGRELECA